MAIVAGDVLQLTEKQRQAGQPILNVYFYEVVLNTDDHGYEDVAPAFVNDLWTMQRKSSTSSSLTYETLEIRNMTNGIDMFEFEVGEAGTATTTEALPPYATVTIKLVRSTLVTRNGYKRYAGIVEGSQTNGLLTSSGQTAWQTIATNLATPQAYTFSGDAFEMNPVIVKTLPNGDRDFSILNPIGSAVALTRLGTQNTRKIKAT